LKTNVKVIIGISLIAFSIALALAFKSNISPYLTVSEVVKRGEAYNVQVNGTIVPNSTTFYQENNTRVFLLTDGKEVIKVVYKGAVANYQEGIPAVVVGDYKNGVFYAKKLLLKCPSKYQTE